MNETEKFSAEVESNIERMKNSKELEMVGIDFINKTAPYKYSYNFTWLGRPIIQYPQDIIAMQEIIWRQKPDIIIETGVAHGGSLILYASILELLGNGKVIGIDIDIRKHNRMEIEAHTLYKRISLIEGSSTDNSVYNKVSSIVNPKSKVMVVLDSNHTNEHVLQELNLYSELVSPGQYCVIFDTVIEYMPEHAFPDRPWGPGNNPKTAIDNFLESNKNFVIDHDITSKLLATVAPSGYLRRIK